jgi:hypothetical protein
VWPADRIDRSSIVAIKTADSAGTALSLAWKNSCGYAAAHPRGCRSGWLASSCSGWTFVNPTIKPRKKTPARTNASVRGLCMWASCRTHPHPIIGAGLAKRCVTGVTLFRSGPLVIFFLCLNTQTALQDYWLTAQFNHPLTDWVARSLCPAYRSPYRTRRPRPNLHRGTDEVSGRGRRPPRLKIRHRLFACR